MIVHVCKSIIKPVFYISLSSITTTVRQDNTATTTPHSRRILQLTVKGEWNMTNNKFCAYFSNLTQLLLSLNLNEMKYFVPVCIHTSVHNCTELHWSPLCSNPVTSSSSTTVPSTSAPATGMSQYTLTVYWMIDYAVFNT